MVPISMMDQGQAETLATMFPSWTAHLALLEPRCYQVRVDRSALRSLAIDFAGNQGTMGPGTLGSGSIMEARNQGTMVPVQPGTGSARDQGIQVSRPPGETGARV